MYSHVWNRRTFSSYSLLKSLSCAVALESHYSDLNMHIFNLTMA